MLIVQSCLTICDPMGYSPPGSSVLGDSPGKNTGVGCHALLQGNLPNPGIEPRSSTLQADSLPSEAPGKPKNTGVGSLSLLQGIFLTQEWNRALLHCSRILTSWAPREAHNDWLLVHKRGWLSRGPAHYSNSISDSNKLYTPLSFSLMSGNSFTASAQTMAGSRDDLRFYA